MAVVYQRWLQRVNATETAGGIAITGDASTTVLFDHLYMITETTCCARVRMR
jgi:hypothetical protein